MIVNLNYPYGFNGSGFSDNGRAFESNIICFLLKHCSSLSRQLIKSIAEQIAIDTKKMLELFQKLDKYAASSVIHQVACNYINNAQSYIKQICRNVLEQVYSKYNEYIYNYYIARALIANIITYHINKSQDDIELKFTKDEAVLEISDSITFQLKNNRIIDLKSYKSVVGIFDKYDIDIIKEADFIIEQQHKLNMKKAQEFMNTADRILGWSLLSITIYLALGIIFFSIPVSIILSATYSLQNILAFSWYVLNKKSYQHTINNEPKAILSLYDWD